MRDPDSDAISSNTSPRPDAQRIRVFLSHCRADRAVADDLFEALREAGIDAWYDRLIPPGANWRDTIDERIRTASIVIFLLSAAALQSEEIPKELAVARDANAHLLPVRLEDVSLRRSVSYELQWQQRFDLFPEARAKGKELAHLIKESIHAAERDPEQLGPTLRTRLRHHQPSRLGAFMNSLPSLSSAFGAVSAMQLCAYQARTGAFGELTSSGHSPLIAALFMSIASSVGSPLMLLHQLSSDLEPVDVPLALIAALNTIVIALIVRVLAGSVAVGLVRRMRRASEGDKG